MMKKRTQTESSGRYKLINTNLLLRHRRERTYQTRFKTSFLHHYDNRESEMISTFRKYKIIRERQSKKT